LLPRRAVVRSAVSGGLLAAASFATYWWQLPAGGELQARGLALVVLMGGYQTLIFAERLALADSQTQRIPTSMVFWAVWCAAAFSLAAILYVPLLARLFRVSPVDGAQVATAIALGVAVVAWRLLLSGPIDRTSGKGTR